MLQASPSLSFSPLAFCLLFLLCISAQHFSFFKCTTTGAPDDLYLYVIQKRKKKSQSAIPFAFYCLKCSMSLPHVMCVFPFSPASIFPWKPAPAPYRIVMLYVWAAHAWAVKGVDGKVSVTDRQTAWGSLCTCVSQASVVSWHVYISNHSHIAVVANRHLQLFVWLPHK